MFWQLAVAFVIHDPWYPPNAVHKHPQKCEALFNVLNHSSKFRQLLSMLHTIQRAGIYFPLLATNIVIRPRGCQTALSRDPLTLSAKIKHRRSESDKNVLHWCGLYIKRSGAWSTPILVVQNHRNTSQRFQQGNHINTQINGLYGDICPNHSRIPLTKVRRVHKIIYSLVWLTRVDSYKKKRKKEKNGSCFLKKTN